MINRHFLNNKAVLAAVVFFTLVNTLWGQSPATLPYMFLNDARTTNRQLAFGNHKLKVLSDIIKETSPGKNHPRKYVYPIVSFDALINLIEPEIGDPKNDGMRVYFGAFTTNNCPADLLNGWALPNQVVLIFAAKNTAANFYVFDTFNAPLKITAAYKDELINNYLANIVTHKVGGAEKGLLSTIDVNATENHEGESLGNPPLDTKHIYYTWEHFKEYFRTERDYQNKQYAPGYTDGVEIGFAAIPSTGLATDEHPCKNDGRFKKRLHIVFNFCHQGKPFKFKTNGREFHPSDCSKHPLYLSGDNGQLCPYSCNN
ncbi:MAG: hypothetical protein HYX40_05260 [Sphingobacteriales bacterium]|nr:hypothetical protein [Sphingobacteriales bacterium]